MDDTEIENTLMNPQDALVALMVVASISDENLHQSELRSMQRIIKHMPIFEDYTEDRWRRTSRIVFDLVEDEEGLDAIFEITRQVLPKKFFETAYALACDVVAADGRLLDGELVFLEAIRDQLEIQPLNAVAIERGARARHMTL